MIGLLNLAISNLKQFYNEIDGYINPRPNRLQKWILMLDSLGAFFLHGATPIDYIGFEFWRKSYRERKTFITRRIQNQLLKKYNNSKYSEVYYDKRKFNEVFSRYLKRSWLDVSSCTFEEFQKFLRNHPVLFIKPVRGRKGQGIKVLNVSKELKLKELFADLRKQEVIIEEKITPGELSEFNPASINTIRVVTLRQGKNITVKIAAFRMGNGEICVDNFNAGGICATIDVNTGIVITQGINKNHERFIKHPYSGKQIIGYQVPKWNEIKDTIVKAAAIVQEIDYVGWDVTINEAKEVVIIEGNCLPGHDIIQEADQIGKRAIFPV